MMRERRPITNGVLLRARSIGTVTCCSTSSAAKPGYGVMTTTPGSEMSGYASSLSCANAHTPPTAITRAATMTSPRRASAKRDSASSRSAPCLAILEEDRALDDDPLAGRQSRDDGHAVREPIAERDFATLKPAGLALDEDDGAAVLLDHGGDRHDGQRARPGGVAH